MISKDKLEKLNGLSPEEYQAAVTILKQYAENGESELFDELKYSDFEEIPVDIDTFLDDDDYLGHGIWQVDEFTGERKCTLFPYWRATLHRLFPDNLTTSYNTLILTGAIGLGKAQPLNSLVLTKTGFKCMGDITMQDSVYGADGKLHTLGGIFPQGKKKICKVSFTDGTSTLCCDEHLWTIYNTKNKVWTTVETKQLIDGSRNLKHAYGHRYKIPMTKPVEFEKKTVFVDPYILGVLIGDGSLTTGIQFASNDQEIVNTVSTKLAKDYVVKKVKEKYSYSICHKTRAYDPANGYLLPNEYAKYIKQANLNTTALNKHIPQEYLYNDIQTRIELLQGLMDTDGYISKDGSLIEFTTISEQLKNDFVFLVQSLGGTCHIRTKSPSYKNKNGEKLYGHLSYNIGIKLPKSICPFKLARKTNRIAEKVLEPYRYITNIEYVGEDDCQCIYVNSNEHLYLTNDFIATHNTLMGVLAQLYLLYRMLCLKDPYTYYGMMPSDKITFSMLNITLDAAQGVGWDKMQQLLQGSPWFMTHGNINASRTNPQWQPPKGVELIFGSNNRHVVGRALFANLTDEVNFGIGSDVERKKEKQKKMIAQIDARMKSRFMKGTFLPTLNIIISSKDTEQAFLNEYINIKKQNESKTTIIIDEPQWVVRNDKGTPNDPGSFYVAVGNKFLAHELLPVGFPEDQVEKYREKGYLMLRIPPGFREDFETNLDQALMDIAGLSTSSATKYISGVRLNQAKVDTCANPFNKDVIEVGNAPGDNTQYAQFFDLSKVNPKDLARPLFIHLDMSMSGDKTGIAGIWITGKSPSQEGEESSRELRYKLAFSVSVKAPRGYQISFEKNRNFIRWLRDHNFSIKGISSDTFQSAQIQQQLKADGFNTKIISVDRVTKVSKKDEDGHPAIICIPYQDLKSAIYERRVEIYKKCDLLTDELVGLERLPDGHIDHTSDGVNSKDQADAFCGAMYLAGQFADEYSYSYGESLESALIINMEDSNTYKKHQMIADFEAELSKCSILETPDDHTVDPEKKEEIQRYQDISDGIIII